MNGKRNEHSHRPRPTLTNKSSSGGKAHKKHNAGNVEKARADLANEASPQELLSGENHLERTRDSDTCKSEEESTPPNNNTHLHLDSLLDLHLDLDLDLDIPHSSQTSTQYNDRYNQNFSELLSLPDDVLYIIISFLNKNELCKLCLVCTRFYHMCSKDSVWLQHLRTSILHSGLSCRKPCTNKELCRLSLNWIKGRFHHSFLAKHRIKLIPWLQKEDKSVWFSFGNVIRHFHYDRRHGWKENKKKSLHGMSMDATRFSHKHNMLASGCRDGRVHLWSTASDSSHVSYQNESKSEILCVDLTDQAIVSGSKDGICQIVRMNCLHNQTNESDLITRSFDVGERVWSLQVSPCEGFFIAGLAGFLNTPPLVMWDIESGHCLGNLGLHHRHGAGVLGIKFESQHEILTCGYDTILRLWDLRTKSCVSEWVEPYDYTLYSLASDGGNAIAVGTSRHGLVRLWDKRSRKHVQCYYSNHCSSPVYSLAMDYSNLFLAVDMGFSTMDFSIR